MAQITQTAIMDAFVRLLERMPMEQITVQKVVRECGISRNTFYYHYRDIYALLEAVFQREVQRFQRARTEGESGGERLRRMEVRLLQKRRVINHIYHSINHTLLQQFLFEVTEELCMEYIRDAAQGRPFAQEDMRFVCRAYQSMLMGILLEWVGGGMKADLTSILEQVQRFFLGNTRQILEAGVS